MADRVLPGRKLLPVIRKALEDKIADLAEGESLGRTLEDGHGDQGDVGVRGLHGGASVLWPDAYIPVRPRLRAEG